MNDEQPPIATGEFYIDPEDMSANVAVDSYDAPAHEPLDGKSVEINIEGTAAKLQKALERVAELQAKLDILLGVGAEWAYEPPESDCFFMPARSTPHKPAGAVWLQFVRRDCPMWFNNADGYTTRQLARQGGLFLAIPAAPSTPEVTT